MPENLLNKIAKIEKVPISELKKKIASGSVIIVRNRKRMIIPLAIGKGLRTKINANIGTSPDIYDLKKELKKLHAAVDAGTDAVMDLSTGGDIDRIRRAIVSAAPVAVGTVPIYQVAIEAKKRRKSFVKACVDEIFEVIEKHLDDGVDFVTVHCGITRESVKGRESAAWSVAAAR